MQYVLLADRHLSYRRISHAPAKQIQYKFQAPSWAINHWGWMQPQLRIVKWAYEKKWTPHGSRINAQFWQDDLYQQSIFVTDIKVKNVWRFEAASLLIVFRNLVFWITISSWKYMLKVWCSWEVHAVICVSQPWYSKREFYFCSRWCSCTYMMRHQGLVRILWRDH